MYLMFVCVHLYVFIENKFNSELNKVQLFYAHCMPTVCLASSPGSQLGGGGGGGGVCVLSLPYGDEANCTSRLYVVVCIDSGCV